jgi:hypothetical protein
MNRWVETGINMAKGVRKSITIPGLLAPAVKLRCAEFGHAIFTPYAVELVCYDLRSDAKHTITLQIARDTQAAQDAVDRELVAHYRPGQPRKGLLVQLVERIGHLQNVAARSRHEPDAAAECRAGAGHLSLRYLADGRSALAEPWLRIFVRLHHRTHSLRSARRRTACLEYR